MKKFITYLIVFFLPLVILGGTTELLLRNIPNDYKYKNDFLSTRSPEIEVLFLGSSHAYYGINPEYINKSSFNAAYISQSLDYDYKILQKYNDKLSSLKYIVLPISYFTFFSTLKNSGESWRVKNYIIYYGMKDSDNYKGHSEVLSNKLSINMDRIKSYYIDQKLNRSCSDLGWGIDYNSVRKNDLEKSGEYAALRHTNLDTSLMQENKAVLQLVLEYAKKKNIKVLLFTPPAYKSYVTKLNENQLRSTHAGIDELLRKYPHVHYRDFMTDTSFIPFDFYDADHLNERGAEKLTRQIDSLINAM